MSFQDDVDTDRSAVFMDATGSGFAESVTYTTAAGVATAINVVTIEQIFSLFGTEQHRVFHVSAADVVTPLRGDRIATANGETFQTVDLQIVDGMWELRTVRKWDRQ